MGVFGAEFKKGCLDSLPIVAGLFLPVLLLGWLARDLDLEVWRFF